MKYIPVIFICLLGIAACRKSNHTSAENNGIILKSIISDSAGTLNFGYNLIGFGNNLITSMNQSFLTQQGSASTIDGSTSVVQYTNIDSNQLVTVGFFTNSTAYSINYLLTWSKLPLKIFNTYTEDGIMHSSELANFIYFPNTDILDSVIYNRRYSADTSERIIFKFNYSGQNITQITASQISSTQTLVIGTFDFTYSLTANVFRQTDPLLYIYSYPYSVFHAQPMVIASFFAETFSLSTFNSITISGIISGAWPQNSLSSKMDFHLNSNGKVTAEIFSNNIFESLAGKKYLYE